MAINNIFLIEDHDEALKVWRRKQIKNLDLVHIDAHLDFGFHSAQPIPQIFNAARTLKELKRNLEQSLAFLHYQKDLDKQTNIGNYIYPAIGDGIIKDFYWVVPGGKKEFKGASKIIKSILKSLTGNSSRIDVLGLKKGIISVPLLGRKFTICTLEKLPFFRQRILLDIDTDFLVINSLLKVESTNEIGKRKPWIGPRDLVELLKKKAPNPAVITIAYSVNGGFTPMKYKQLGDEMAYHFAPHKFSRWFKRQSEVAENFNLFISTRERKYYKKVVRLNPTYRLPDNNYGPLYLMRRKFALAENEFKKILRVDPENPACFLGLGEIALGKREFKRAKRYFRQTLNYLNTSRLFWRLRPTALLGLAKVEFSLKNFKKAKELLARYRTMEPLQGYSCYLLGRILEKEKNFSAAAAFYKDSLRLGFLNPELLQRLLKISFYLPEKVDIIEYVRTKYRDFRKGFLRAKRLSLRRKKKIVGLHRIEKKMRMVDLIYARKKKLLN